MRMIRTTLQRFLGAHEVGACTLVAAVSGGADRVGRRLAAADWLIEPVGEIAGPAVGGRQRLRVRRHEQLIQLRSAHGYRGKREAGRVVAVRLRPLRFPRLRDRAHVRHRAPLFGALEGD